MLIEGPEFKSVKFRTVLFVLALICCLGSKAQKVDLITLDQLYKRINNGRDTVYVINFWATWCLPCVKELPDFEKLSGDHRNQKLKVLLVSLDFKSKLKSSVIPFVKKYGIRNEVFLLDEPDPQVYINRIDSTWSGALPATVIIREKKRVFFEKDFTYKELLIEYNKFE